MTRDSQQQGPQAKETTRRFSSILPIEDVQVRIFRDYMRGISDRSLSATYRMRVPVIRLIVQEQTRKLQAQYRRAA